MLNLLSNAFKFTIEGEIVVGLREEHGEAVFVYAILARACRRKSCQTF